MIFENICKICKERNISIYSLERGARVSNGSIKKWEKSSPQISSVKKVADYLGCTIDELISENDVP